MSTTIGDLIVAEARKHLGVVERPWASNLGEPIETWQYNADARHAKPRGTYRAAPWCAIFVGQCYVDAGLVPGIDIPARVVDPYTGYMYDEGLDQGWILPSNLPAPPGSILVKAGKHTEIVVHDRRNGLIECIGGNVNHGARGTLRARADWSIIVPPVIRRLADRTPQTRREYFAWDLDLRPTSPAGPWKIKGDPKNPVEGRELWIAKFWKPEDADGRLRRYRTESHRGKPGPWYHVEVVLPGTNLGVITKPDGTNWTDKESRDRFVRAYAKRTGHRVSMRSVLVPIDDSPTRTNHGPLVTGGSTT